tara:strand:+ start:2152 stop:3318 length:1167 start_codon:yes stop_codon:yes gene_type:complete
MGKLEIEKNLVDKISLLKESSGSHSPSINAIRHEIPELKINVDACFLSNPYATELFIKYLEKEIVNTSLLREVLEFYPSQNELIASDISKVININPKNIFVGNGAIEIIQACLHNFCGPKIIVNIPTFSSYYEFVPKETEVLFYKLKKELNFKLEPDKYVDFVKRHNPSTVVIINPNNPDGSYVPFNVLKDIIGQLKDVDNILIDESFIHFAFEDDNKSQISAGELINQFPNVIVIKSMSKDFGIAGIRAGYGIMNQNKVESLLKNGYLWNSSGLAEYFFKLYKDKSFLKEYSNLRLKYINEAQEFFNDLNQFTELNVYPSMANFALVEILNGEKSFDFVINLLVKYGIYFRSCSDKIGLDGEYARIACRTKDENNYILDSLRGYFSN